MKKLFNLFILFTLVFHQLSAQTEFVEKHAFAMKAEEYKKIQLTNDISSIALKSSIDFNLLNLTFDNEKIILLPNDHMDNEYLNTSQLIFLTKEYSELTLSIQSAAEIELYFLKVPNLQLSISPKIAIIDFCKKPAGIDQDIWRAGLPVPTVGPTFNQVNHCIIHHSAGSNTATDFTEVVRNIYLYHTDVNGWDDIGYNYLIAPDGTLYHGRDGQNIYSDDNVRGAHFCAKNTGTMGVCLLGDFTTVVPQLAALSTLEDLLLWKLNKESLLPGDSARHPVPGGAFLGRVVGHQDGCATACPGTFLYADIPAIIDSLESRINDCLSPAFINDDQLEAKFEIYPNPAQDYLIITSNLDGNISLIDLLGREVYSGGIMDENFKLDLGAYPNGTYYIRLITKDRHLKRKLLILH